MATIKQYALDMMVVVPCWYMGAPENLWDTAYSKSDLDKVLNEYASSGASRQQVDALRKVFDQTFKPQWVQDIREAARKCHRANISAKIGELDGPARPLSLRPPFHSP